MSRVVVLLIIITTLAVASCDRKCGDITSMNPSILDSSFVEIFSEPGLLFTSHFHPCDVLGSSSTWINHPDTSLYQPIVAMPQPFDLNSDFVFYIYFKSTTLSIEDDPNFNDLYSLLEQTLEFGFNKSPHIGDIIFYIRHDGKRYANSWDPESVGLASPPYIKDRTGLNIDVVEYEIVQNDCRESGPFPAIRLVTDVKGYLVTSNMINSLWIEGRMDFLISTSVF